MSRRFRGWTENRGICTIRKHTFELNPATHPISQEHSNGLPLNQTWVAKPKVPSSILKVSFGTTRRVFFDRSTFLKWCRWAKVLLARFWILFECKSINSRFSESWWEEMEDRRLEWSWK